MKKLAILPLLALAGGMLASCGDNPGPNPPVEPSDDKLGPAEIFGHKRVTKLENGKSYYYAVVKFNEDDEQQLMFLNGDEHWGVDSKTKEEKYFPYYMGETEVKSEDDIQNFAAKVKVDYVNDTEFTLLVEKEDAMNDQKYVGVYKASSTYGNDVMSIHCDEEVGADYYDEAKKTTFNCDYNFTWLEEYNGYKIQTAVIMIQDERHEEETAQPKFIGTGKEYVSMDCANGDKATQDSYYLAYFYEV